jgi:hypothetical protein
VSRLSGYLIEVQRGERDVAQFVELQSAGLAAARAGHQIQTTPRSWLAGLFTPFSSLRRVAIITFKH